MIEVYENCWHDMAIVVNREYIIYDKIDRTEVGCHRYTDDILNKYIENGFKLKLKEEL